MSNFNLFADTMARYAQATGPTTPDSGTSNPEGVQDLDPNSLQVGQEIYDPDGTAHTVIQNENGNVTTMPSDQTGQQVPQGVKSLQPMEIQDYSQAPPQQNVQARKRAQELGIDWEELESIALEVATFAQGQKEKAFFDALDRLNTAALSYVSMPTDISPRDMKANRKAQQAQSYLKVVNDSLLEAFAEAASDIQDAAYTQEPGFLEVSLQGLLDDVNNRLLPESITALEGIAEQARVEFIQGLEDSVSDGTMPADPNLQKLIQYYEV